MKNTAILPFYIYLTELWWRLFYIIIGFSFTFFTTLYFIDIFLLLEVFPFTKLVFKTLIATHITELFDAVIHISLFVSCICIFPFVCFQTCLFFSSSLYSYQLFYLKISCFLLCFIWVVTFLVCYNLLLPQFFTFFTHWEVKAPNSYFILELNAKIQFYLVWVNNIYSFFSFFSSLICISFIFFFLFFNPSVLFYIFKNYRKYLSFFLIFLLYMFTPPDCILQIFLLAISFINCDLIFFLFCFRFQQCLIPDSSIG